MGLELHKTDFKVPTNITELFIFLGLANQFGIFIPDLAHATPLLLFRKTLSTLG